ncbi:MAG: branched-chain amino acid transport system substrate-binding protein [Acidimicrobiaceae bacterium]|nr:branched-chain amino acid transport system substrate-binding protein [Acidimicrobiaceae bacterium]
MSACASSRATRHLPPVRTNRWAVAVVLTTALVACSHSRSSPAGSALIVVNAPFAAQPFVANSMARGTELAVDEINGSGGVPVGNRKVKLQVQRLDDNLSPATSAANVRKAIDQHAVAVIDEGTGTEASAPAAAAAGLPIGIVYEGGQSLVDRATRPSVFRIAPTDRGVSFRLAEYLVPKGLRIAVIHDDSTFGADGANALDRAFAQNRDSVATTLTVPASANDPAPQVLEARRSGATALLVWARPATVATVVRSARASGWNVPVYSATSGEDPLVRQQLSDHPDWLDGLTFAASRLTSEKGPAPFEHFRTAYEGRFGAEDVGVTSGPDRVVQPPDWAMYPYDFVHIVAAAMTKARSSTASPELVAAMEQVEVPGANGDERSFNERNHEGVVDDDIFFASFRNMVWAPVKDDPLSATLPAIPQTKGK